MARAADGTYTNPNTLVPNTLANATRVQENMDAIALALTDSLSRTGDGGLQTDTSNRDYALSVGQAQDGKPSWGGTATGTTSAIVVTLTPVPTAIVAGMEVAFLMGSSANAAAATLDIGITTGAPPVAVTYPIRRVDGTAIQAGDLAADAMVTLRCDGTGFRVHSIVQGDIRNTLGTTTRTADATLGNADNAYVQDCTSAVTLTLDQASALTAGWWGYVRNNSTSAVTLRGYRAADQAVNGDFASGSTGWTLGAGWSVGTTGVATAASAAISQAQTLTAGSLYEVTYTVVTATAGTVTLQLTGGTTVSGTARSTAGTYTEYLRAVTGNTTLGLLGAAFSGSIDNISVRKVEEIDGVATKTIVPGAMQLVWCDGTTSRLSPATGPGNATVTSGATSITLTASSARVQSVTMTAAAQSVTLPDATTLSLGGPLFVIHNAGDRPFGMRSNGGALLAVVAAGGVADCYLESTATAAGQWAVNGRGLEPALTLVDATLPSTYINAFEPACRLTDTLSIHFCANSSTHLFAFAVDSTAGAGAAGTPTAVDTAGTVQLAHCFRISDTQAIAFWTQSTNHKCAVLTVAGTTVSVGTVASTTTAFLNSVSFTGAPLLAQLSSTLYVATYGPSTTLSAVAISVSGTSVTIGTGVSLTTTFIAYIALYPVTTTAALALFVDDGGTAGTPYTIRGVSLSISGTTITAPGSGSVSDVVANATALPSCQLSATSYIVGYYQASGTLMRAVVVTYSGGAITFGTPLTVETAALADNSYVQFNANRFQPNLYAIDSTRALFTFGNPTAASISRHVVLSNSGGTLTAGAILYGLFAAFASTPYNEAAGGNFPQTPSGFLAMSSLDAEQCIFGVNISGTTLSIGGTLSRGDVNFYHTASRRFGLSGGVFGVFQFGNTTATAGLTRAGQVHLFRFRASAAPQYLGSVTLNDFPLGALTPVEIASNKVAFITGTALSQPSASIANSVRLLIVEFAA